MLVFRRRHDLGVGHAGQWSASFTAPGLRVGLVRSWGLSHFDSAPLVGAVDAFPQEGSTLVEVVLAGTLILRHPAFGERVFRPGDLVSLPSSGWNERNEGDVVLLTLYDSTHASNGTYRTGSISRWDVSSLLSSIEAFQHEESSPFALIAKILRVVAWQGDHETLLRMRPPEPLQRVSDALSSVLSQLHARPQWIDVAARLAVSERHARRLLLEAAPWLGPYAGPSGWRRQLHVLRLLTAVGFLAHKGARLEDVARASGYGTARAMLRSFELAGVPPPRIIRQT